MKNSKHNSEFEQSARKTLCIGLVYTNGACTPERLILGTGNFFITQGFSTEFCTQAASDFYFAPMKYTHENG